MRAAKSVPTARASRPRSNRCAEKYGRKTPAATKYAKYQAPRRGRPVPDGSLSARLLVRLDWHRDGESNVHWQSGNIAMTNGLHPVTITNQVSNVQPVNHEHEHEIAQTGGEQGKNEQDYEPLPGTSKEHRKRAEKQRGPGESHRRFPCSPCRRLEKRRTVSRHRRIIPSCPFASIHTQSNVSGTPVSGLAENGSGGSATQRRTGDGVHPGPARRGGGEPETADMRRCGQSVACRFQKGDDRHGGGFFPRRTARQSPRRRGGKRNLVKRHRQSRR